MTICTMVLSTAKYPDISSFKSKFGHIELTEVYVNRTYGILSTILDIKN